MDLKVWTKEEIRERLEHSDMWVIRGLVAIYDYQTPDEQCTQDTHVANGVGFNKMDADILSSFVEFYERAGFLSSKQMCVARKRILKYAGQLARIAKAKAVLKAEVKTTMKQVARAAEVAEQIRTSKLTPLPVVQSEITGDLIDEIEVELKKEQSNAIA